MSLHKNPETPAEHLALHLETNYGLQLDPVRHAQLVKELDDSLRQERADFQARYELQPYSPEALTEKSRDLEKQLAEEQAKNAYRQ